MTVANPVQEMLQHIDGIREGVAYLQLEQELPEGDSLKERHERAGALFCLAHEMAQLSEHAKWRKLAAALLDVVDSLRQEREAAGDPELRELDGVFVREMDM